ncbi:hypothetical protein N9L68_04405 [bacterium]|nr:hypothetical protein [bacterium]
MVAEASLVVIENASPLDHASGTHGHPVISLFENIWNTRQEKGYAVYRALHSIGGDCTGCLWRYLARELISIMYAELRQETWAARQGLARTDSEAWPPQTLSTHRQMTGGLSLLLKDIACSIRGDGFAHLGRVVPRDLFFLFVDDGPCFELGNR